VRTFGKYELLEPLATGGMAEVWRARAAGPEGVEKEVALKLVRGEHGGRGDFARMFLEEARLAARLTHANVVQLFELVEEDGRYAIAMELVRGHDLGRVLERCREAGIRFGLPRALQVGVELARGLDYAHRLAEGGRPLGLVHRDVSPHNVLLSLEGEVKLADFGIARAMGQAGLTDPGTVKGKLAYMAPEQARGEPVDARADVFALGVLLWELCTGRRLFARETDAATLTALLTGDPPSPASAWNEAVPPELDRALEAALQRAPSARTATAGQLGSALSAVLLKVVRAPEETDLRGFMRRLWPEAAAPAGASEPTAVRPAATSPESLAAAPGSASQPSVTRTLVEAGAPATRRRWLAAAVGLGAALALGLLLATRGDSSDRPAPPASPTAEPPLTLGPGADAADAARGEGRVVVTVHPWASLTVDARAVGETPQDLRLPAGRHRLRATHPTFGAAEIELTVEPGRRLTWHPTLSR
jgi:serine/threonine-protein kinase